MCPTSEGHYVVYDKATGTWECCKCGQLAALAASIARLHRPG